MAPKPLCVVNPRSAKGRTGSRWAELEQAIVAAIGPVDTAFTTGPDTATDLVRSALGAGRDWIVAVGGDGTVHEVVNGFFDGERAVRPQAALSFVMRGTGNDLRRTLSGARSLPEDLQAMAQGTPRTIDLGRLTYVDDAGRPAVRYFDNLASFGMSGAVDRRVNASRVGPVLGGTAAFAWGTLRTLMSYRNQTVTVRLDDGPPQTMRMRLVVVANGRYAGGGMCFAPDAAIDDGQFDVVAIGDLSTWQVLQHFPAIYRGAHVGRTGVTVKRARKLEATSDDVVLLDVDGEAPGRLPATFEIVPAALRVRAAWAGPNRG